MPVNLIIETTGTTTVAQELATAGISLAGGTTPPVTPPVGPPTPPDVNVYPLQQTGSPPYILGTGPDQLSFVVTGDGRQSFQIGFRGTLIAGPLTPAPSGPTGYTIRGSWGPLGTDLWTASPVIAFTASIGMKALNFEAASATYNGSLIDYLVPDAAAAGSPYPGWNTAKVWDQGGAAIQIGIAPPSTLPPPPPPPPPIQPLTVITGATINGAAAAPDTLAAILAMLRTGDVLKIPAGRIVGTSIVSVICTISGAGPGQTIIDATGQGLARGGKGALVPTVDGAVITDMTITGAAITGDNNGAGVRGDVNGIGFTLRNVEITGNQDGILTSAATVVIDGCNIHDDGAATGNTHETYFTADAQPIPASKVTITNTNITCGAKSTHAVKSRFWETDITGGTITQGVPGVAPAANNVTGSAIDIPQGGIVNITDTTIVLNGGDENSWWLGYGTEINAQQPANPGNVVTLTRVHLVNNTGKPGMIVAMVVAANLPTARLVLVGCTYETGKPAPVLQGWATVTGAFTPA